MSKIFLYNTLTRTKEEFRPQRPPEVRMYNCGPTVYDYAHIGNLRAYIFADILRRTLEWNGYEVRQVINITDVGHLTSDADSGEDKMTRALRDAGEPLTLDAMKTLGAFYAEAFKSDLRDLNIEFPDVFPVASEHIREDIELVKSLEEKGYIYATSDGIYFDTSKVDDYAKLAGSLLPEKEKYARISPNPEKRNVRDFALWKFSSKDGSAFGGNELGWESPWGKGFPGWHIECSAMAMKHLGETLDIHTGGIDHIPVHHTNEIAQSESATGKPFARFWLHNNHLLVNSSKIAKSEGTGISLKRLKERGYDPLAYRYFTLTAHYRKELNFSWDALTAAQNSLERLYNIYEGLEGAGGGSPDEDYMRVFEQALNDDLNTPQILAVLWDMLRDEGVSKGDKKETALLFDTVLGFNLGKHKTTPVPQSIQKLVEKRETAREKGSFDEADALRKEIEKKGYEVRDNEDGADVKKKK